LENRAGTDKLYDNVYEKFRGRILAVVIRPGCGTLLEQAGWVPWQTLNPGKHFQFGRTMLTICKPMNFQSLLSLLPLGLLIATSPSISAQTVATKPAGFYSVQLLGNSDTIVSIPFARPASASGRVQGISDNTISVQGAPPWTPGQFVYSAGVQSNTYHVRLLSGPKEGAYFPVIGNGADTLTVDLGGDSLDAVTSGTRLAVIPYWTLGTAFPNGQGVFSSPSVFNRRTEVLIPNFTGSGINLSASRLYFYLDDGVNPPHWRYQGGGSVNRTDDVLLPDVYFIVRHNVATNTLFKPKGMVPMSKLSIPLNTQADSRQDNPVALARPVAVTLNDSGLLENNAFTPGTSAFNRGDEILVFDNSVVAKNKSAAAIYYRLDTWRRLGASGDFGETPVFVPATGVVIRKVQAEGGPTYFWMNTPGY
jgi:uncharacterized protein (TIGR02597 family)